MIHRWVLEARTETDVIHVSKKRFIFKFVARVAGDKLEQEFLDAGRFISVDVTRRKADRV